MAFSRWRTVARALRALAILLAAASCRTSPQMRFTEARTLSAATGVGAAPILAVSRSGAEAAAWVSAPDGGSDGRLYVSVNEAPPVEIRDPLGPIEAHGEAPPKLAYGGPDTLYAIYVVGKVVPDARFPLAALRFIRSNDNGRSWSAPVSVTGGGDDFGSHNFHALHVSPDGTIHVSWLGDAAGPDAPGHPEAHGGTPHEGSATWITRSADGGATWTRPIRVHSGEACPCCRTALATAPDGSLYIAWRAVFPGSVRDIVVARSMDRGSTWSTPVRVRADDWVFDGCPHAGPSLQVDSRGRVHIAWWTGKPGEAGVWYARSDDGGRSFQTVVPLGTAAFSRPAHAQLALGGKDTVIAVWEDARAYPAPIVLRTSVDGGIHWSPAERVDDGSDRAVSFPVLAVTDRGITVAWSEQSIASAERESASTPDMRDPNARMGLKRVGDAVVRVKQGAMR